MSPIDTDRSFVLTSRVRTHPRADRPERRNKSVATTAIVIDRERLAWAGGFFDGEGHVGGEGDHGYPGINIKQAGSYSQVPEVFPRFRDAVCGLGYIYGPMFAAEQMEHLPQWAFEAHGFEAVQAIFAMLWPWLGPVKRAQFAIVLRKYAALPMPRRNPGVRVGRPLRDTCPNGHDYSDAYIDGAGRRSCRKCRVRRSADFYRQQKAATSRQTSREADGPA